MAMEAERFGLFSKIFDGTEDLDDVIGYFRGKRKTAGQEVYPEHIVDRIESKTPYPVLRHHFGLPSLEATIDGVGRIAEAGILDVISIGPDQNTQQFFFRQENMNAALDGAGGVPLRSPQDLARLYQATRRGNHPLLRCYSGTEDVLQFADMLKETIHNAWCAVPLCWYNVLDGRGSRLLHESMKESQSLMKWHAERDIPVEVNEAHHWGLRDAHDTISVVMAYLAAYNAKKIGVKHYIAQYMFNVPPGTYQNMDLAKMLAKIELIEALETDGFKTYRQVRAGLSSFSSDPFIAKGQLAASASLSMLLKPHILHVVGFSEGDHVAEAEEVIESVKIVRGVLRSSLKGTIELGNDRAIMERKQELVGEAKYLLNAIKALYPGSTDPYCNPHILSDLVERGILDAPLLKGNSHAKGQLVTRMIDGKCLAYSSKWNRAMTEAERMEELLEKESTELSARAIV